MFDPTLKNKFYAALWGFIVGDALGVPYEFSDRKEMMNDPAIEMIGYRSHDQPAGTWSDDTSMMLCVLENIQNNGSVKDLANLFLDWYYNGYHTANGEAFDIGNTTL
jgi:ADP-ribosylglycohydrolase